MNDYIRKAVELADGFRWLNRDQVEVPDLNNVVLRPFEQQWFLDALAAQLVRQVDALDDIRCDVDSRYSEVWGNGQQTLGKHISDDRTMNTIKAIVDSGVLSE